MVVSIVLQFVQKDTILILLQVYAKNVIQDARNVPIYLFALFVFQAIVHLMANALILHSNVQ